MQAAVSWNSTADKALLAPLMSEPPSHHLASMAATRTANLPEPLPLYGNTGTMSPVAAATGPWAPCLAPTEYRRPARAQAPKARSLSLPAFGRPAQPDPKFASSTAPSLPALGPLGHLDGWEALRQALARRLDVAQQVDGVARQLHLAPVALHLHSTSNRALRYFTSACRGIVRVPHTSRYTSFAHPPP